MDLSPIELWAYIMTFIKEIPDIIAVLETNWTFRTLIQDNLEVIRWSDASKDTSPLSSQFIKQFKNLRHIDIEVYLDDITEMDAIINLKHLKSAILRYNLKKFNLLKVSPLMTTPSGKIKYWCSRRCKYQKDPSHQCRQRDDPEVIKEQEVFIENFLKQLCQGRNLNGCNFILIADEINIGFGDNKLMIDCSCYAYTHNLYSFENIIRIVRKYQDIQILYTAAWLSGFSEIPELKNIRALYIDTGQFDMAGEYYILEEIVRFANDNRLEKVVGYGRRIKDISRGICHHFNVKDFGGGFRFKIHSEKPIILDFPIHPEEEYMIRYFFPNAKFVYTDSNSSSDSIP